LDYKQRHEDLILTEKYNTIKYPKYENYNAINIENTNDIPENYFDEMGVPITFLDKYNPDQFEIVGLGNGKDNFIPTKLEKLEKYNKNGEFEKHVILDSVLYIKFDFVKDIKKYQKERIKYLNENKN
jgi:lysozyme family protein